MNYIPFKFRLYTLSLNRDIYGFHLAFSPIATYKAEVLEKVVNIFSSKDISIVYFALSIGVSEGSHGTIFIDLTGMDHVNLDELASELRQIPYITDVKLIKPVFRGFIYDSTFHPLMVYDNRAIILMKNSYEGLIKQGRKQFGTGFNVILYYTGYDIGAGMYDMEVRRIGEENIEKLTKIAEAFFQQLGYGILRFGEVNLEEKTATLRIENLFECELFKDSGRCESHLVRGIIAGWFSRLFKGDVEVKEVKCIAKGDPYCEFKVRSKSFQGSTFNSPFNSL